MTDPEFRPQPDPQPPPPPPGGDSYDPFVADGLPQPQVRYPFWGWLDLVIFALLAAALFVVVNFGVAAILIFFAGATKITAAFALTATFLFYGGFFLLLGLFFRVRYGMPLFRALAWNQPGTAQSVVAAAWGLCTSVGVILMAALLRTPRVETPLEAMLRDPVSLALVALFAVTLGPLCEELIFRGFIFPVVARSFGVPVAVVLTALPFALLHGAQYAWMWQHLLMVFIAGAGFGLVRHLTGSTAAATYMHAAYNATFVAGLIVQRSGLIKG